MADGTPRLRTERLTAIYGDFRAVREVYAGTCKVLYAPTLEDALASADARCAASCARPSLVIR